MPATLLSTEHPDRRLPRFLLASLALHALAVLALWQAFPHFGGQLDTVLSVTLGAASVTPSPAPVRPQTAPAAEARHLPHPQRAPTVVPAATEALTSDRMVDGTPAPIGAAKATPVAAAHEADGAGIAAASTAARVRARLLADLARYFEYPALARLRGWQGTVIVGLRVEPDGQLDKIEIAHSSGYALLDQAAVDSLRRVERLVDTSAWLNGRSLDMQLPVIYRLLDR